MEEILLKELSGRDWLRILNQSLTNPQTLPQILQKNSVSTEHLVQLARKSVSKSEAYGRQILYKSPEIEVMIARWDHQASSSPHNHGFSKGLIWFLQGDFHEQQFEFLGRELRALGEPVFFREGDVATVVSNDIHSCTPVSEGISLHFYSPAIQSMKVWDTQNQQTLTVADECGAWVPSNADLIVKKVKWASI